MQVASAAAAEAASLVSDGHCGKSITVTYPMGGRGRITGERRTLCEWGSLLRREGCGRGRITGERRTHTIRHGCRAARHGGRGRITGERRTRESGENQVHSRRDAAEAASLVSDGH